MYELSRRASCALRKHGLRKGDVLAIISPNTLDYPIIQLAAMAIGATITAFNPLSTPKEISYLLNDSGARFVILHPFVIKNYEAAENKGVDEKFVFGNVDGYTSISSFYEEDDSTFMVDETIDVKEDVAMMFYSSGTTGLPKGVMLSHRNINSIFGMADVINELHPIFFVGKVCFGLLPFYHIYGSILVLFLRMVTSKKLIIVPRFDPEGFLAAIQKYKIEMLNLVPPLINFLAKSPLVDNFDLSSVSSVFSGGASLSPEVGQLAASRLNLQLIYQGFGMTETTGACHFPPPGKRIDTIGYPLPSMECKIVDSESKKLMGPNEVGELRVRGPNVMLGYWKKPKETSETMDEDGFLRTGDIGYYDDEGLFYLVDRIKELIKYKGYQVAPAELEAILNGHPAVLESAVIGVKNEEAGELPRAIIVKRPNQDVTAEDLITYVNEKVSPQKKLRGGVIFVADVPKLPSGKILRRALREQYGKA
ncbi:uncharacterized protein TRIADDRAFT_37979 [Trichoplax adhaerens]|uniref:4-coumarate--CoA ligase n=1 Tax=Trichoplax adhaerens TaxID=10228 RepID=B3S1W0_TRIAD|nr:hypothetical protein TRIADDRAFT_37979 [Trichoplax adhaerens]EDV23260.1 hypothetical protein TRIADDRAFT_37979 [Trichoplax adhaerens]|eukprot:XP_002114170.1 hypothetical protein TRIADDRAFT_37979 [Trichoplax adhaerens]